MAIPGDKYLITLDDVKRFYPVAEIDGERLNPYILQAQSHDLRPVLGEALYYDFMKNFDNTAPAYAMYAKLIGGEEYNYQGYVIPYEGIHETISWFTLARFIVHNDFNLTRFGTKKPKQNDKSDGITPQERAMLMADFKANGIRSASLVQQYLIYNQTTFPLYPQGPVKDLNRVSNKWIDL